MTEPLFDNAHRQAQYEAMLQLLKPGERLGYTELLDRMKAAGDDWHGIGMTLEDLAFRGYKNLWRRSEIVSYHKPFFDHYGEGNWTEGGLYIARAEAYPDA